MHMSKQSAQQNKTSLPLFFSFFFFFVAGILSGISAPSAFYTSLSVWITLKRVISGLGYVLLLREKVVGDISVSFFLFLLSGEWRQCSEAGWLYPMTRSRVRPRSRCLCHSITAITFLPHTHLADYLSCLVHEWWAKGNLEGKLCGAILWIDGKLEGEEIICLELEKGVRTLLY